MSRNVTDAAPRSLKSGDAVIMAPMRRYFTLAEVAEVLDISAAEVWTLVRNGDLPTVKIEGRRRKVVEGEHLTAYILRGYAETHQARDAAS